MERNTMDKRRLVLILTFLSIFIIGTFLIFTIPPDIKITYGKTVQTKDGETISFNVFEPNDGGKRKPAILIGHGTMVNKETLKEYAIELAASGFVAIAFDFRGHGQSSGEINRNLLTQDVKAIKEYLETRGDIYIHKLGYIGYSMGGGPGNKIVKDDKDFKCFIGIGTGLSIDDDDCKNRTLNILMILAKYDEGRDLKTAKEEIADRLDMDAADVKVNTLYGSFEDGDATKLFYDDNSDHFLTPYDSSFIREARDWVKSTFPNVYPIDENYYANIRALILVLQLIGGIGFFFLILDPICRSLLKNRERKIDEKSSDDISLKNIAIKTILYSLIFFVPGILILLPFFLFLSLTVAGFVLMLLYGQVLGILFLLWRNGKRKGITLKETLLEPFKDTEIDVKREILVGIFLSLILYLILYLSIGLNYLGILPSFQNKIYFVPIYISVALFMYIILGLYFQKIIQDKIGRGFKNALKSSLFTYLILMIYFSFIISLVCVVGNTFFYIMFFWVAVPLYLFSSVINALTYEKTGNILVGAFINVLYFTFLLCTLSPFQTGLEYLLRLLH